MNDHISESELDEFLKLFEESYPTGGKAQDSAPDMNITEPQHSTEKQNNLKPQSAAKPSAPNRKAAKKSRRALIGVAMVILVALVILAAVKFFGSDTLKGTWDLDGVTVYRFDGNGNGSLDLPSNSYPFIYEIRDNEVNIDFESEAARDVTYRFTVEKNKLILISSEEDHETAYELIKK